MHEIVVAHKGITLRHCLQRMLAFCALDAYRAYDRRGALLNAEHGDVIHEDHVHCVNAMHARCPLVAWQPFIPGERFLGRLPQGVHLLEMPDQDWPETRDSVAGVIAEITNRRSIGIAAATKVLALKRPDLVPACDAQLVTWCNVSSYYHSERAAQTMDRLREIGRAGDNLATLRSLQAELATRELDGEPIRLSTTRILEVLCWMATTDRYTEMLRLLGWE